MKLILQIVRKDFVALGSRWAVWLGVLAVKAAVGIYLVGSARLERADFDALQGALVTISVTDVALTVLFAALLVHSDPVVGSDAAWMTRPIARWRLLMAKLATGVIGLVGPAVLLALPWWWYCGFGPTELMRAGLDVIVLQLAIVLPAMTLASVTRTLPQMFITGVGTIAVVLLMMFTRKGVIELSGVGYAERVIFCGAVVSGLTVVMLPWIYLRGRTTGAVATLVCGVGLAALAGGNADDILRCMRGFESSSQGREPKTGGMPSVTASFESASVRGLGGRAGGVVIRYKLTGVPEGFFVGSGRAWHEWKWPYGGARTEQSPLTGLFSHGFNAQQVATGKVAAGRSLLGVQAHVDLAADRVAGLRQRATEYRAKLRFELVHMRTPVEVPLVEGKWQSGAGRGLRVLSVVPGGMTQTITGADGTRSREQRRYLVEVLESEPAPLLGELVRGAGAGSIGFGDVRYVLRHVNDPFQDTHGGQARAGVVLCGVAVRPRALAFATDLRDPSDPMLLAPGEALRLSVIDFRSKEMLVREVRVPNFMVSN